MNCAEEEKKGEKETTEQSALNTYIIEWALLAVCLFKPYSSNLEKHGSPTGTNKYQERPEKLLRTLEQKGDRRKKNAEHISRSNHEIW